MKHKHETTVFEVIDKIQKNLEEVAKLCTMHPDLGGFKNPAISTNQISTALASLRTV